MKTAQQLWEEHDNVSKVNGNGGLSKRAFVAGFALMAARALELDKLPELEKIREYIKLNEELDQIACELVSEPIDAP